jgi:hypothetical protein
VVWEHGVCFIVTKGVELCISNPSNPRVIFLKKKKFAKNKKNTDVCACTHTHTHPTFSSKSEPDRIQNKERMAWSWTMLMLPGLRVCFEGTSWFSGCWQLQATALARFREQWRPAWRMDISGHTYTYKTHVQIENIARLSSSDRPCATLSLLHMK